MQTLVVYSAPFLCKSSEAPVADSGDYSAVPMPHSSKTESIIVDSAICKHRWSDDTCLLVEIHVLRNMCAPCGRSDQGRNVHVVLPMFSNFTDIVSDMPPRFVGNVSGALSLPGIISIFNRTVQGREDERFFLGIAIVCSISHAFHDCDASLRAYGKYMFDNVIDKAFVVAFHEYMTEIKRRVLNLFHSTMNPPIMAVESFAEIDEMFGIQGKNLALAMCPHIEGTPPIPTSGALFTPEDIQETTTVAFVQLYDMFHHHRSTLDRFMIEIYSRGDRGITETLKMQATKAEGVCASCRRPLDVCSTILQSQCIPCVSCLAITCTECMEVHLKKSEGWTQLEDSSGISAARKMFCPKCNWSSRNMCMERLVAQYASNEALKQQNRTLCMNAGKYRDAHSVDMKVVHRELLNLEDRLFHVSRERDRAVYDLQILRDEQKESRSASKRETRVSMRLREENEKLRDTIKRLSQEKRVVEQEKGAFGPKMDELRQTTNDEIQRMTLRNEALTLERDAYATRVEDMRRMIEEAGEEIESVASERDVMEKEKETYAKQVEGMRHSVQEMHEKLEAMTLERDDLVRGKEANEKEMEGLRQSAQEAEKKIEVLLSQLNDNRGDATHVASEDIASPHPIRRGATGVEHMRETVKHHHASRHRRSFKASQMCAHRPPTNATDMGAGAFLPAANHAAHFATSPCMIDDAQYHSFHPYPCVSHHGAPSQMVPTVSSWGFMYPIHPSQQQYVQHA